MIRVVVLCFRDISSICWRIFAKLLSLVHLETEMNWLHFGVKRSKVKVTAWSNTSQIVMFPRYLHYLLTDFRQTCHWCILGHRWPDYVFGSKGQSSRSHHRGGDAQHSTLPSSATFSSYIYGTPEQLWFLVALLREHCRTPGTRVVNGSKTFFPNVLQLFYFTCNYLFNMCSC